MLRIVARLTRLLSVVLSAELRTSISFSPSNFGFLNLGVFMRGLSKFLVAVSIMLAVVATASSQFDPTFGSGGVVTTHIGDSDWPISSLLLSDQKILVLSENFSLPTRYHLLRYNADGTPDNTYGTGGRLDLVGLLGSGSYGFTGAVQQSDGKIVIVGGESEMGLVVRLNENGTLDTSFNGTGMRRSDVTAGGEFVASAAVQPDGKILIAGTSGTPESRLFLIRYNSNGTFDTTFGTNNQGFITHSRTTPRTLLLQSTGKFIVSQRRISEVVRRPARGDLIRTARRTPRSLVSSRTSDMVL